MTQLDRAQARVATTVIFVILGAGFGAVAARMPSIKAAAGVSDGELGLALFGLPLGTIVAMQFAARLVARHGSRRVMSTGVVFFGLSLPLVAATNSLVTLIGALVLVGMAIGFTDISMNAHAVVVEKLYARPVMSSFHAFFSMGGLAGSATGGLVAHAEIDVIWHFLTVGTVFVVVGLAVTPMLLPAHVDAHSPESMAEGSHKVPWSKPLFLLGLIGFCSFVGEGAAGDWSAVYLSDHLGSSDGFAALGFAAFSLSMTTVRLFGDRLTSRFGGERLLSTGGLIAGAGLGVSLVTTSPVLAVAGWLSVGIGLAAVAPVAFSAAGNLAGVPAGSALAKVGGFGYFGVLLGPPVIGALAEVTSLRVALIVPAVMALSITVLGPAALRSGAKQAAKGSVAAT